MSIWKVNKSIQRLNQMIDNAIEGSDIETGFDETKISALETKLSLYLSSNSATKTQLAEEKGKINQLISDISHQTKTPLSNILLYTQLLSESELSQENRNCVNALMEQSEKLNFLISSLVKASRLEAGVISVSPKLNSVTEILDNITQQAQPKALEKNISICVESTDIYAFLDSKWTIEALYNLLDNSIKYSPLGSNIMITTTPYPLFCRIDIIDSGIGISEDETTKIFSRFYRSPSVNEEEGVGIGLFLAREIISAQGGYIKVISKLGEGSTFSVYLPLEG